MPKKILVPIDGSDASLNAFKYAVKMAEVIGRDAFIVALEVINIEKYELPPEAMDFSIRDKLLEERKKEVENHLSRVKNMCGKRGVNIEAAVRYGFPHEEIIKYAEENEDIILIVMGASGKGFLDRQLLGSVTNRIVQEVSRKLPCPIMVAPYSKENKSSRWNFNEIEWCD